jgi:hypothetical protein
VNQEIARAVVGQSFAIFHHPHAVAESYGPAPQSPHSSARDYTKEPKDSRVTQTTSLRSSAAHHRRSVEAISQRVAKILPDVL